MAILNMVSSTDGNSLDEARELLELYMTASPEIRKLLLESSRSISDNRQFRKYVAGYKPPFRLMDLPAELRLLIAELVLSSNVTHKWRWLSRQAGKQVGTFKGLYQLTALSRVSRKLHAETLLLAWKLNKFVFNESLLGEDFTDVPGLDVADRNKKVVPDALAAYSFFKGKVPLKTLRSMGTIVLQVKGAEFAIQQRHCRSIRRLAAEVPAVQFQLELLDWDFWEYQLSDEDTRTISTNWQSVADFFKDGFRLRRWLGDNGYFNGTRNWRVFPTCKGRMSQIDKYITGDCLRIATDWYDQGL